MSNKVRSIEQFMRSVDTSGECWLWNGRISDNGYGQCSTAEKPRSAHRASWVLHYGIITRGLCVLHRCDVRHCVNPKHLFLGSRADNQADMAQKGRGANGRKNGTATHPERLRRGETNHKAKLTTDQVMEIRHRYDAGGLTTYDLAEEYGVGQGTIHKVVSRNTWRHI